MAEYSGYAERHLMDDTKEKIAQIEAMLKNLVPKVAPVKPVEEVKEPVTVGKDRPTFYKGYDVRWLRGEPDHPDFYLVAEYDEKYGKVKK